MAPICDGRVAGRAGIEIFIVLKDERQNRKAGGLHPGFLSQNRVIFDLKVQIIQSDSEKSRLASLVRGDLGA